jgi:hypothetical protein
LTLDLARLITHAFSIATRHRWLWFLGAFGGVAGGYNFGGAPSARSARVRAVTPDQVRQFLSDHLAVILSVIALLLVIALLAFVISCVAVPASIWAGLELDAGRPVGLRDAWREGRSRFGRFLQLALLKAAIGLAIVAVVLALVFVGIAIYRAGGVATVVVLALAGALLFIAVVVASVVLRLALTWSDRLLVILELDAVDAVRASWWLFKHSKLDTVVFGVVLYVVRLAISVVIALLAGIAAIPGIVMVFGYFGSNQATVGLLIAGITWVLILGGGVELIGAGFLGALTQVGYALAARDLVASHGLQGSPA